MPAPAITYCPPSLCCPDEALCTAGFNPTWPPIPRDSGSHESCPHPGPVPREPILQAAPTGSAGQTHPPVSSRLGNRCLPAWPCLTGRPEQRRMMNTAARLMGGGGREPGGTTRSLRHDDSASARTDPSPRPPAHCAHPTHGNAHPTTYPKLCPFRMARRLNPCLPLGRSQVRPNILLS